MFQRLRNFLKPPKLKEHTLNLRNVISAYTVAWGMRDEEERSHRHNIEEIAKTGLDVQKDAFQQNLIVQHRTMIIALAAVVVSILASTAAIVVALTHDTNVTLKPNITVKVYEPKTSQTLPKTTSAVATPATNGQ